MPPPASFPDPDRESNSRARAARELKDQWGLFDAALSHTPDFTYIFDRDGRFLYINRALLDLWQKSFQEAVGRNFHELGYPVELADRLQRQIQEVIATRQRVRDRTPYTGADGASRHYEYIFVPVFADGGDAVTAVVGSTRDITDQLANEERLRQANERLNRSNEELARFTDVVSHDLQEPLRMVSSYIGLVEAQAGAALSPRARGYLDRALAGTQRMSSMIRSLLEHACAGEHAPFQPVDLGAAIATAIDNLTASIAEAQAVVTGTATVQVLGDPLQLTRLFQNLIGNAIKFRAAERTPRIEITCAAEDGGWAISVRDNGIGIPSAYLERIFAVFHRVHARTSYEGTGIGLAICRKIATSHGGSITVASEEGVGTTFQVHLPRA